MVIKDIQLTNFRNYHDLKISFSDNLNIIYGNNGSGKTNLLESVYVLGFAKSHKFFLDNNLIKTGENFAIVKGTILDNIPYELEVLLKKTKKEVKIDKKEIKKIGNYINKTNMVVFYSEDLDLIRGMPIIRRKYLDLELSQISSNYYNSVSDFNKLLKLRNEYLKKISDTEQVDLKYFEVLTDYYIRQCIFIYKMRNTFISKINNVVPEIYKKITGDDCFSIEYKPIVKIDDFTDEDAFNKLKKVLNDNYEKELRFKSTLIGPHRDDFEFYLNHQNLKYYGSQGQQRVAVIALKLSEIQILKEHTGKNPIVLLDDVFSDLDYNKKDMLLDYMSDDIQVIITTTDLSNINQKLLKNANLIHIEEGKIVIRRNE